MLIPKQVNLNSAVISLYNPLNIQTPMKHFTMRSILYIIAVILIIGWAIGTFAYAATGLIHILLVIAIIALILGFLRRDTTAV
jgi:Family of unknown function (DUF5670)